MKPIFQGLVALSAVLLIATLGTAYIDDFTGEKVSARTIHMLLGLVTALVLLAVHGFVVLNYFIATGKAMEEALERHPARPRIKAEGRKLKMVSSPAATMACIWTIVAAVLGGLAMRRGGSYWHVGFAWFAVLYNFIAFRREYYAIIRNMELLEEVRGIWRERKVLRLQVQKQRDCQDVEPTHSSAQDEVKS